MYNILKQAVSVLSFVWSQSVPSCLKFIFVQVSCWKHLFGMSPPHLLTVGSGVD